MWEQEFSGDQEQWEQFENFFGEGETGGDYEGEYGFGEMDEMDLAAELLSITNERELDQFLGGLIKKAGKFIKSPVGRALGGVLKGIAKKALPVLGGAIGSFVAPGVGTALGSSLGSAAGRMFGLEVAGMSNEDRDYEVARRYVRLASAAAKTAAAAPKHLPPQQVASKAVSIAARTHAPGLLTSTMNQGQYNQGSSAWGNSGSQTMFQDQDNGQKQSGRWIRRGRKIILFGV